MAIKIFLLGRPGSGKSSAARRIEKLVRKRNCSVVRINDYNILQEMSVIDDSKFRKVAYGGFDVLDFSVLDVALKEEERVAKNRATFTNIIVIEFARSDYYEALKKFSRAFLQDAYFVFFNTDVETCIQRIRCRAKNQVTSDDYFVSERIVRGYYAEQEFSPAIANILGIDEDKIVIFNNNVSRDKFDIGVSRFVNYTFEQHPYLTYENKVSKAIVKVIQGVRSHEKKTILARAMSIVTHIPQFETRFL
ncbi:MAG TPA: AAA family ATPase [Ktedonobacteraceae bacterium]|nr:AAA family ATPase [Ktedonobacteraceae bacterium]